MKAIIVVGCLALGLVGCTTNRGRTGDVYGTEYGSGWSQDPGYYATGDAIYPVRRQPSIQGDDSGDPRPIIDPTRQSDLWGSDYVRTSTSHEVIVQTEPDSQVRATSPRDPIFNR